MGMDVPAATPSKRLGFFGVIFLGIFIVLAIGMGITGLALAGFAIVKGGDVLYSATYMVQHWSDTEAFPPNAQFCKGLFCRRTDTTPKHVCGSPRHQSELLVSFCPDHHRSDALFFLDLSHLGTLLWYAYCAAVVFFAAAWIALGGWIVLLLVCSPVLLLCGGPRRGAIMAMCGGLACVLGTVVGLASGIAYAWW